MQLTDTCDIWRLTLQTSGPNNGKKLKQAVYTRVPCLRVPISTFDTIARPLSAPSSDTIPSQYMHSEARVSTDVFLVPAGTGVRLDDEIRRGRYINNAGQLTAYIYTVDGIQDHDGFGYQHTLTVFCTRSS